MPFPSYIYLRKKSGFSNVLWRQHTTEVKIDAELLVFTSVEIAQDSSEEGKYLIKVGLVSH